MTPRTVSSRHLAAPVRPGPDGAAGERRGLPGRMGGLGSRRYASPVSTRRLILTSLLCGLAILMAFTVQVVLLPR